MEIVQFTPPVVVSPNAITLPAGAPDIAVISGVVVARMQSALNAHAAGAAAIAHGTTAVAVGHAGAAVAQHAAHAHDLVSVGVNMAPGDAIGWDAIAPTQLQDANANAALHTFTADNVTGCMEANIDTHVCTQPTAHPAADIVASIAAHAAGVAGALADHVAADIEVAMTATRISARTFSLNLDTEVADIVILSYHEVGARVSVS